MSYSVFKFFDLDIKSTPTRICWLSHFTLDIRHNLRRADFSRRQHMETIPMTTKLRKSAIVSIIAFVVSIQDIGYLIAQEEDADDIQAAAQSTTAKQPCEGVYSAEEQTLVISCVDLGLTSGELPEGEHKGYTVKFRQVESNTEEFQFILESATETVAEGESSDLADDACRAVYTVDDGKLYVPCAGMRDEDGVLEPYGLIFQANPQDLSQPFKLVELFDIESFSTKINSRSKYSPQNYQYILTI